MTDSTSMQLVPIGLVRSPINDLDEAPRQGDEGAPKAWIDIEPAYAAAMEGLAVGDEIVVITWLHLADRGVLTVHPRSDPARELRGVFATRSPNRPNPVGLHPTTVLAIDGTSIEVAELEAIHGTPVVDVKTALGSDHRAR